MTATVVLVHGAFHGGWCWDRVVPGLTEAGVDAVAVDLPGHGVGDPGPVGDLRGDAAHVRGVLAGLDGPVVLVGHSYGGAVISEAGAGQPDVVRLVYLAAVVPDVGETLAGPPPEPGVELPEMAITDSFVVSDDGTTATVAEHAVRGIFYHDCSDDDVAFAQARLSPQSTASFAQTLEGAAWRDVPSTYVLCLDDRTVPPAVQRAHAARTTDVVELDTSHSPFFSRPDLIVDLLAQLARDAG
jgi:pimeloyl-ACP methyl ester carboxylesterase